MKDLILGIDPGTRNCGFGIVAVDGDTVTHVEHGVIVLKESWSLPERLKFLQLELHNVYTRYEIRTTAIEKIFFGKNADSAFKLGHARGVCMLVSAQHGADVAEYAAKYVKKCVTGSGSASKDHVQMVVFNLLRVKGPAVKFDASDALSLALTHARDREINARMKKALEGSL